MSSLFSVRGDDQTILQPNINANGNQTILQPNINANGNPQYGEYYEYGNGQIIVVDDEDLRIDYYKNFNSSYPAYVSAKGIGPALVSRQNVFNGNYLLRKVHPINPLQDRDITKYYEVPEVGIKNGQQFRWINWRKYIVLEFWDKENVVVIGTNTREKFRITVTDLINSKNPDIIIAREDFKNANPGRLDSKLDFEFSEAPENLTLYSRRRETEEDDDLTISGSKKAAAAYDASEAEWNSMIPKAPELPPRTVSIVPRENREFSSNVSVASSMDGSMKKFSEEELLNY